MARPWVLACWSVVAAFGAYASMYAFRKPFTAGSYTGEDLPTDWKAVLITSQVLGYTVSKFLGIKVTSEVQGQHRAWMLVALIGFAHAALVAFAVVPTPWQPVCLFLNGLPLGMVFGLVLGFLEGRRLTEAFVAGLCASFIVADGLAKSTGALLLEAGVTERWMPAAAGGLFLGPLLIFVAMLRQIPSPSRMDCEERSPRTPMTSADRWAMLRRHGPILVPIIVAYLLITILRSVRADYAPELWRSLGVDAAPALFTQSELVVALGVVLFNGATSLLRDNRTAFQVSLLVCLLGVATAILALAGVRSGGLQAWGFMVLLGLGLYLPYVAIHTTVFERLIALGRDRGNLAFLMSLADAAGYLGYAATMLVPRGPALEGRWLDSFLGTCGWLILLTAVCLLLAWVQALRLHSRWPRPVQRATS